jgi:putative (di)nucleoside polyphosphate hydrolase
MIEDSFVKGEDGLYRKNVGIVLQNKEGMVFVGQRFGTGHTTWQMPQGGIGDGETEEEALTREIAEEIGIFPNSFEVVSKTKDYYYYVIPKRMRKSIWNNLYIGQRQRWFLGIFKGKDEDINISTEFPEFNEWCWMSPLEISEKAIIFKQDLYKKVFFEFKLITEDDL